MQSPIQFPVTTAIIHSLPDILAASFIVGGLLVLFIWGLFKIVKI